MFARLEPSGLATPPALRIQKAATMLTNSGLLVLALITSVRLLFPKYFAAKPAEALTIRSVV